MESSFQKALLTVATLALCVIAVQLIPISRDSKYKFICAEATAKGTYDSETLKKQLGLDIDLNQQAQFCSVYY